MNDKDPFVTIVIPTFNRSSFITNTLLSVQKQTYQNWECIIVDDFSTDDTKSVVEKIIDGDKRFKFITNQRKKGAQGARNTGIINAKAEWIAFNDSDDEWLTIKLEKQLQIIYDKLFNPLLVIHCDCVVKDQTTNTEYIWNLPEVDGDKPFKKLLKNPSPMFQGLVTSKQALKGINYLDEDILSYQEWDTTISLSKNCNFIHIKEPLFIYHKHTEETISKDIRRDILGVDYIRVKFRADFIEYYSETYFIELLLENIGRAAIYGYWDLGLILLEKNKAFIPPATNICWVNCFNNNANPLIEIGHFSKITGLLKKIKKHIYG
jgi:glycosyltransferase involved in cell wall biosynthesis